MLPRVLRTILLEEMYYTEQCYIDIMHCIARTAEKLENQQSPVDWSFVRLQLGRMSRLRKHSQFVIHLITQVIKLFHRHHCRDFPLIADVLQLLSFMIEFTPISLHKAKILTDNLKSNLSCFESGGLNYISKLLRVPYESLPYDYISAYDVVQMLTLLGENKHLKELLHHGVMYIPLNDNRSTWSYCRLSMVYYLSASEKNMVLDSSTIEANFRQLPAESIKRVLAVFKAVEIILIARKKPSKAKRIALCFRMAYETIPEPVITSQEVASFLRRALSVPSADALIQDIVNDYEKLFPESVEPRTPRKMKILCRYHVRQKLRQLRIFPHGASDLQIPSVLQRYVCSVENNYMLVQYNL